MNPGEGTGSNGQDRGAKLRKQLYVAAGCSGEGMLT